MKRRATLCFCLFALSVITAAAQRTGTAPADSAAGTWNGTWEGGGSSGGFELTLEKSSEGRLGGRVSVTGEPAYKAELKTAALEGNKLTATYDFPPEPSIEVSIAATIEGDTLKGTWLVREKGSGNEVAQGTFAVAKKQADASAFKTARRA